MHQQATTHAAAMKRQISLHAATAAELQRAQNFIADELAKRDEAYRVARERRLEEAQRAKLQAQKEGEPAVIDQRYRRHQVSIGSCSLFAVT